MTQNKISKICPECKKTHLVSKLIVVDQSFLLTAGRDPREKYFSDLRVSDIHLRYLKESPLEQFIEGLFCNDCQKAFVSNEMLCKPELVHRLYGKKKIDI